MSESTCPFCGDGMESVGTLNHIECVAALGQRIAALEAQLRDKTAECERLTWYVDSTCSDGDVCWTCGDIGHNRYECYATDENGELLDMGFWSDLDEKERREWRWRRLAKNYDAAHQPEETP